MIPTVEYKNDRRPIKENDLVSEQPGFFILFIGVVFSVIVGLSIRTAAQSDWFRARLTEAISNVGKDWRIQHGTVGLYFRDGIKPAIGLYANDVKIASESSCYMKSGGFAQRVKIPLSIIKYIIDGQLVSEIDIQDFKIEITEKTPVCNAKDPINGNTFSIVGAAKKNQITIVDRVEKSSLRNEIERVRINRLEIYYPHEKYDYFSLKNIVIENRSSHPKILFMEGDVDLSPLVKSADEKKFANLKIEYNEFPEKIIKSNLFGSLREGFFSVQLVNRMEDKKFQLQAELKNVSLSFLKSFVNEVPKDINLKSNWVSMKLYVEGLVDSLAASSAEVKEVTVNGDLGEFSIENLNFARGVAHSPNAFEIKMKGADLSKIFTLNVGAKIPDQIESMGYLDGQINYLSDSDVKLNGAVKSLEVAFSANSNRKKEVINIDKLTGAWAKKNLQLDAAEIKNKQGAIDGTVRLKTDGLKSFELEALLKNIKLANDVSELVTGVETPLVVDEVGLKLQGDTHAVSYKALGKLNSISHQYFDMANVAFSVLGNINKNQEIDVKADRWQNTDKMRNSLSPFGLELPAVLNKPKIKMTQTPGGAHLKIDSQSSFRMNATLVSGGDGRSDSRNEISGAITLKDQEWKIYGTRDNFKIDKK
ncbi:MAG: hypothetical protein B7Y39_15770 [Bdellovibrio sp. 28-41-41]|nr:MAG: hypothetical protein B7Y39_15770 [Bdellovibrio sp. 28-41-41]